MDISIPRGPVCCTVLATGLGVVAAVAPGLGPATLAACAGVLEAGVGVPAEGTAVIVALEKV